MLTCDSACKFQLSRTDIGNAHCIVPNAILASSRLVGSSSGLGSRDLSLCWSRKAQGGKETKVDNLSLV